MLAETPVPNDSSLAITNQPTLAVDVHQRVEDSYLPYRYAFVTAGTAKYTFLVPDSYRVQSSDPSRLKIVSSDLTCMITLSPANGATGNNEVLCAKVNSDYPNAEIVLEHEVSAINHVSPAVDYTWKPTPELTRKGRMTLIPVAGGLMEFSLVASPEKFEEGVRELNLILQTFRGSTNGQFEYVKGSKFP